MSQIKFLQQMRKNEHIWSAYVQEADLVTTHELGHNFGAEHDPDNIAYCAPSDDQGGKFVMYPIAVSGDHVNNKVKTCSLIMIYCSSFCFCEYELLCSY